MRLDNVGRSANRPTANIVAEALIKTVRIASSIEPLPLPGESNGLGDGGTTVAFEGCGIASWSVTAFLFDLDGTLLDSVYQHVLSWREALEAHDIQLSVWKIHRKIGMSGGLFTQGLLRETGRPLSPELIAAVQEAHAEAYQRRMDQVRPLPGAQELLDHLSSVQVPWAVATSGRTGSAAAARRFLDIPLDIPVVTRDDVEHAKPDPDLFTEAARRLGVAIEEAVVVGDSVWDLLAARRARALGVGLLSGGYGEDELIRAGAYRVYADPSDLLAHLDEVGGRRVGRERDGQR